MDAFTLSIKHKRPNDNRMRLHIFCLLMTAARGGFVSRSSLVKRTISMSSSSSTSVKAAEKGLYSRTPLIHSAPLSKLCDRPVYLKLDLLQPSGSFKDRGMAHLCQTLLESKGKGVKLISSSGGNAGLAVTTVASQLGMDVTVIVPETTKPLVVEKLASLGAKVTVFGKNWNAADELARERAEKYTNAQYVSPYDNSLLWTGHSSLMDEVVEELPDKFGAIVASVGGGGLICGILEGIVRHSLYSTRVITSETEGAASFQKAWLQGKPIRLESIDSVATSLGALEVTPVALERAKALTARGGSFVPQICTDAEAIDACLQFAAHHRMLVEPACGAALAVVCSERLRSSALDGVEGAVVVEVCGGSGVNLDLMQMWKEEFLS